MPEEVELSIIKEGGYQAKRIKLNTDVSYQEFIVHLEKRNAEREAYEQSDATEKEMKPMNPEDFEFAPRTDTPHQ